MRGSQLGRAGVGRPATENVRDDVEAVLAPHDLAVVDLREHARTRALGEPRVQNRGTRCAPVQ